MATPYEMPKLAMAMNEGTINEWLVQDGQKVEKGQPILSVETEKTNYDCESPHAGYLKIVVAQGQTVPCSTLIAHFADSEEELVTISNEASRAAPANDASEQAPAVTENGSVEAIDFVMPKLAMAMNEGTVNEWLVADGDYVEKAQVIASVETEKVTYEIESPDAGYFHIVAEPGKPIPCGELIGHFVANQADIELLKKSLAAESTPADAPAADKATATKSASMVPAPAASTASAPVASAPTRAEGERIIASPLAKKIAIDNGLDLSLVAGSGPNGRILKHNVLDALARGVQNAPVARAAVGGTYEKARIPFAGMRKVIADRMMQSQQTTAQLSSSWDSDITELLAIRKKFVAREEALGTKVSVNAFIIKAIATAIKQVPIANSCLEGDEIVIYDSIHMGIAIAVPGATEYDSGLMVAVLRNVETMGVVEIDKQMKALIHRVRNGEATPDDLSGSTITMSSTAGIAPPGLQTAPVLNLPNAVLLGPSTPKQKPVVYNGEIVPRMMMPVSLTFDHRILDGEPASRFMNIIHECLENPELMLA